MRLGNMALTYYGDDSVSESDVQFQVVLHEGPARYSNAKGLARMGPGF